MIGRIVCTGELDGRALGSLFRVCAVDNARAETTALLNPVGGSSIPDPSSGRSQINQSQFPAHWKDSKHEPEGTARDMLADIDGLPPAVEERVGYFRFGVNDGEKVLKQEMNALIHRYDGIDESWDDVTGARLVSGLVKSARSLEMQFFEKMGVFAQILHRDEVKKKNGKTIRGRWIDTNKGDGARPDYRSRFVGKEFNVGVDPELFAATPPLEALKLLMGHASANWNLGVHIMFSDVKRAYFNAKAERELWADIPEEHDGYFPGAVGRLALALYGTRDAAMLWQECLAEHLVSIGFVRGVSNPCECYHQNRQLRCLVHGDDYATAGSHPDLMWMQAELESRFEMKSVVVGHSNAPGVAREGKILNRVVRATTDGWEYECDPRHIELLVEELGLEKSRAVTTPGTDLTVEELEGDALKPLEPERATKYRKFVARANCISCDRADAHFAIKRLVRYLKDRPRVVLKYDWQAPVSVVDIYTDANWAGCRDSRKSTSGGCILFGNGCIRT